MDARQEVDLTGLTVSHYAILGLIAAGGQGRVYRGRDTLLPREVAVKVLGSDRLKDPGARRRLVLEARLLSLLSHQHIAKVYELVRQGDRDYMVMEFVPGATLRHVLAGGPLPAEEVVRLGAQMARGLAAAHAAHVVHCDLKPANIKVTTSGELKILDFGLAKLLPAGAILDNASRTPTDARLVGTVPYMSPEQLRGETVDRRSDIFSAGAVLYEMATGCQAFPQCDLARLVEAIQHADPLPLSAVNPLVPLALEQVIVKAMEKDPRDRHQDALEVAMSLELLAGRGRAGTPVQPMFEPAIAGTLAAAHR